MSFENADRLPAAGMPCSPEEAMQSLLTCFEADSAVNPLTLYDTYASNPAFVQSILEIGENRIAKEGSDFETGLRLSSERERYTAALGEYTKLLQLAAMHLLLNHEITDPNDIRPRQDIEELFVERAKRIVQSDIYRRFEISKIERGKARIASSKRTLMMGRIATAGMSGVAGAGVSTVLSVGPVHAAAGFTAGAGVGILGIAVKKTSATVARTIGRLGGNKVRNFSIGHISRYLPVAEPKPQSRVVPTTRKDQVSKVLDEIKQESRSVAIVVADASPVNTQLALEEFTLNELRGKLDKTLLHANLSPDNGQLQSTVEQLVDDFTDSLNAFHNLHESGPDIESVGKRLKRHLPFIRKKLESSAAHSETATN